jgi:hypothetical protein
LHFYFYVRQKIFSNKNKDAATKKRSKLSENLPLLKQSTKGHQRQILACKKNGPPRVDRIKNKNKPHVESCMMHHQSSIIIAPLLSFIASFALLWVLVAFLLFYVLSAVACCLNFELSVFIFITHVRTQINK